jgi:uncharacterized protein YbjT (DUF2867 family)
MKVFITGGSGFVGRTIINRLLVSQHEVRALIRRADAIAQQPHLTTVTGDTTDPDSLKNLLSGCDAVIHLVGIIREFPSKNITFEKLHTESTKNIVQASYDQGIPRYLHMSANGTRDGAITKYHQTKWAAEEIVRQSGLNWTIFRPSLIFGPQDDFINMLAKIIKQFPLVPVFGDGRYQMQPVHVDDIATAFLSALDNHDSSKKTYCCCGPQTYSYDQLLDTIGKTLKNKSVCKIHQPLPLMKPIVKLLQSFPLFPITEDQLQMLLEGNTCEENNWINDFQINPACLDAAIKTYLK